MASVRGRPRSDAIDSAVAGAVRSWLEEQHYSALTIEGIAAQVGIGKGAIYRRWPSKAEMVFAAVIHSGDLAPVPDTGTIGGDVHLLADRVVRLLAAPLARHTVPGLLADLQTDAALATRFRKTFITPERTLVGEIVSRAVARREIASDADPQLAHTVLLGTVFASLYLLGASADAGAVGLVDIASRAVLGALGIPW